MEPRSFRLLDACILFLASNLRMPARVRCSRFLAPFRGCAEPTRVVDHAAIVVIRSESMPPDLKRRSTHRLPPAFARLRQSGEPVTVAYVRPFALGVLARFGGDISFYNGQILPPQPNTFKQASA